ncbi:TetR/AcrR family transcriptional regulator [Pontibacter harenae]|uniref:TetR/AcrR family transcriptional regulator n=1 Tax=Pontibacter harenae TaxID=2894083 RepID=UPI001E41D86F|nr:TetR/AcrR family transcriptional regulator [Pontibacter harenae]MCC9165583.1 TetR/AcrR family transcriptional regulator [Pontibacter harenae]
MEPLAEKKKAIFESTLELVNENGFHGTPMSMVAKRAGVAAGTIYHYFESKDSLICELFQSIEAQRLNVLKEADDKTLPYQDRFFNVWRSLYLFYIKNPNVLKFYEQFVNSPYNSTKKGGGFKPYLNLIFSFFEEGVNEGILRKVDPQVLGVMVHGNIISTAKIHVHGTISLSEEALKLIQQIVWDGIVKRDR